MSKPISKFVVAIAFIVSLRFLAAQAPAPAGGQAQGGRGGAQAGRGATPDHQGRGARGAAPGAQGQGAAGRRGGPNPDPWPGQKRLLIVADVQNDYQHDAINHTMGVLEELGRKSHAYVTVISTDSQLITKQPLPPPSRNAKTLDYYDAIFMLPSGFTLSAQQEKDLLAYVHDDGKGLIVGHAAGVARHAKFPEWFNLIGGSMAGEFFAPARVIVEDPKFPGAMSWGAESFEFPEQHPIAGPPYSRAIDHVILRLDPKTLPGAVRDRRPDGDYPVVWARQYGKGRVFNIGWGEFEETWDDPGVQGLMLGAIRWALGSVDADVRPRPMPDR